MQRIALLIVAALSVVACDRSSTPAGPAATLAAPSEAPPSAAGTTASAAVEGSGDALDTSAGHVSFHPIHHATLWIQLRDKVIWVDPWSKGDLNGPKADVVLITDLHPDHLDLTAIESVKKPDALLLGPSAVTAKLPGASTIDNGQTRDLGFVTIEAVPAYNLTRGPEPGKLFHDKGRGNGYVLTVGDKRIYLSGDTACTPAVKALEHIDVAFLCMNLPYTMPPEEAAECAKAFHPKVLYPYHHRGSDLSVLTKALEGTGIDVRLRRWYE